MKYSKERCSWTMNEEEETKEMGKWNRTFKLIMEKIKASEIRKNKRDGVQQSYRSVDQLWIGWA